MAKGYKELDVYNISYALAIKVHELTLSLPKYELYEEGSQARRSSKAVASCIVEGYGRNKYKADFVKFLVYSHASCNETICHLNFLRDTHKQNGLAIARLIKSYDELGGKLNKFIQYVESNWK